MSETVDQILNEVGANIVTLVGAAGRLSVPVNDPGTPLEEVTISHGGFMVPGLYGGDYRTIQWCKAVDGKYPDKEVSDGEPIRAQYSPGLIVVKHCVAVPGERDRRGEEDSDPIQFDWQSPASRAYVYGDRNVPRVVLRASEILNDEESGFTVVCLGREQQPRQPLDFEEAITLDRLFRRMQTVRNDRIRLGL